MTRPGTFERVYATIKQQLRDGLFRPGARLEPAALSEELNASVTPVRDALHRLTGERMVEAPRHEGFRAPLLTETTLRHLYAWHRDLLWLALSTRHRREAVLSAAFPRDQIEGDSPDQLNALLFIVAQTTANPEHGIAFETLADRLHPIQRLEGSLLEAVEQETTEIVDAIERKDLRRLRAALARHHRRRDRIVPQLIERLHAP